MALTAVAAGAQQFRFGVEAGVPIAQPLAAGPPNPFASYLVHANPYIAGATAELRIAPRVSLAVDALMRHFSYDSSGKYVPGQSVYTSRTTSNHWEFPLIARYRLRSGKALSPFVNAGAAADWLQDMRQVTTVTYFIGGASTISASQPSELRRRTVAGIVGGGGVDARLHRIHLEPQVRYTFWTQGHFLDPSNNTLWDNRNQVEFLLGITF
jgi:hypothetical protein